LENKYQRYLLIAADFLGSISVLLKWSIPGFWQGTALVLTLSELTAVPSSVLWSLFPSSTPSSCSYIRNYESNQNRNKEIFFNTLTDIS